MPVPEWVRPGIGGLLLGLLVVGLLYFYGPIVGRGNQGLGIIGGGYGASQVAITGADWLPVGWRGVEILVVLAGVKIIASSMTIGTGGSAGDFAPALAIGALFGGAFGLAAQIALDDPSIQPGAFALVGMGTFYGGVANTPLAALVLVCEMAGSYELLVPLMLTEGIAFIALRRVSLYPAQKNTLRDSPVHRREADPLHGLRCADVSRRDRTIVRLSADTSVPAVTRQIETSADQDVFPVVDEKGGLLGLISAESLRVVASNPELHEVGLAADMMLQPVSVTLDSDVRVAVELMLSRDLRSIQVLDDSGAIIAMLDEHDVAAVILATQPPV